MKNPNFWIPHKYVYTNHFGLSLHIVHIYHKELLHKNLL